MARGSAWAVQTGMAQEHLTELAQQWVAEQGDEAGEHLADAIRELRAVGDQKGAKLLMRIAEQVELLEGAPLHNKSRGRAIRRHRDGAFDPSTRSNALPPIITHPK